MSRNYLVLDIETVPDPSLYERPDLQNGVERPFPPIHVHRPVVLGVLWLGEDYRLKKIGVIGEDKDERAMLEDFSAFVGRWKPDLVTYNGRCFDLPVLALRALRHGVPMSWYYQGRVRYRYSEEGHIDLCDALSDHGAARAISLDAMARLIGLPGKVGVDGSQVEGLWRGGQQEAVKSYCLADVAQTTFLFLRYRLLQGFLDVDRYRDVTAELVESLRKEPRLAPLIDAIDGERLLNAA
jgi:3'-5' exonuclease